MRQSHYVSLLLALSASLVASNASAKPIPPASVSPLQRAVVPALRQPAAKSTPKLLRNFARTVEGAGYALNLKLARAVQPANRNTAASWYVIPANGAVCLFSDRAGTCAKDGDVAKGHLWIELVMPVGSSPVPPPGQPVPSTIIGVAPEGVTGLTADTLSGVSANGTVTGGMFSIVATDITSLHLLRAPSLDVVIPPVPGHQR